MKRCHIIVKAIRSKGVFQKRVNCEQLHNAELCNGSTADSDSVCEGSNPSSAAIEVWLSLVERYVRDVEAGGSNPLTSTTRLSLDAIRVWTLFCCTKTFGCVYCCTVAEEKDRSKNSF